MAAAKGGVERSGVTVIVPTTAGAIQLLGLRWSQRIPSSRVVLGNETSDQCERWTKDYNSLLRPGDPMRTLLGLPESGGARLVASAEIDHGRSWIVPVAAAHFADARAQAVHADVQRARMMIWGTGAIDFSQPESADEAKIVENDYHLTSKIDLSRAHFAAAAHDGAPVLCLLPAGPDADRAAGILRKVLGQQPHHIEIVQSLADIIRPIDAFLRKGDFNAPPEMKYAPVPYTPPPETPPEDEPPPAAAAAAAPPPPPPPPPGARSAPPGARSAPPPPGAAPPAGKPKGGLPMGVIGGLAVAAVAAVGVAGLLMRPGSTPAPAPVAVLPQPQPQPAPRPQPQPTAPAGPSSAPAAVQPQVAPPSVAPPQQGSSSDPASAVARLTVLSPPAGSSCQAQVLEMNPRFTETTVDLAGNQPVLEIDGATLCGLAIAGAGQAQARFAPGTLVGTVPSLSSAARIVFNPSNTSGRLPDVAITGGPIEKIELRRK